MSKRGRASRTLKPPTPPNPSIKFGETIEDTEVPDGLVLREGNLTPIRRKLDRMYGMDQWGELELKQYIVQREWGRHVTYEHYLDRQKASAQPQPKKTIAALEYDSDERVQTIMEHFPDLTEAQLPDIRSLVAFQRSLEALSPQLDTAIEEKKHDDVRKIQQTMTSLQGEIRQLQRLLKIDVGSLRGEGPEELRREILTLMDRAKALLEKHAVRLQCPACQEADRVINLGFLLFHFREDVYWHVFLTCPHPECRQGIHIISRPGEKMVIVNGPEQIRPPGG